MAENENLSAEVESVKSELEQAVSAAGAKLTTAERLARIEAQQIAHGQVLAELHRLVGEVHAGVSQVASVAREAGESLASGGIGSLLGAGGLGGLLGGGKPAGGGTGGGSARDAILGALLKPRGR